MRAGDTFVTPDMDDHLWIVLSDPTLERDRLVVVCFLSWQEYHDQSCIVRPGEHPFVRHDTCVNYAGATTVADTVLEKLKAQGKLKLKDPVSPELLERIRRSAENSDSIPTGCYQILREQGFVS